MNDRVCEVGARRRSTSMHAHVCSTSRLAGAPSYHYVMQIPLLNSCTSLERDFGQARITDTCSAAELDIRLHFCSVQIYAGRAAKKVSLPWTLFKTV